MTAAGDDRPGVARDELARSVRGRVAADEPLAGHTTLRVGGPADLFVVPEDEGDLLAALGWARSRDLPRHCLGNGSNLLVPDEGARGVVAVTSPACRWVRWDGEGAVVAGAGYPVQALVNEAARRGLAGLAGLSGVPGTVGGAVVMNAGTAAGETAAAVESARVLLPGGEVAEWDRGALGFGYRSSRLQEPDHVLLSVRLRLDRGDAGTLRRELAQRARRRRDTQPLQLPSAGSVWTNPAGDHAGRLLEASGCKGLRVGDAQVSTKHANFIVNLGRARAVDILMLMATARRRVREAFGVTLQPEIRWLPGQQALAAALAAAEAAAHAPA